MEKRNGGLKAFTISAGAVVIRAAERYDSIKSSVAGMFMGFAGGVSFGFNVVSNDASPVDATFESQPDKIVQIQGDCRDARVDAEHLVLPHGCTLVMPSQG